MHSVHRMLAEISLLIVLAMLLLGAISLFSRRASGIGRHPYHHLHGGAPGAAAGSRTSPADRDVLRWSRGTR